MNRRHHSSGFSLVELLIVLSILILVSGLAIVKLADVYEKGRSAAQAYSLADAARQIEIFYGINKRYPDGWDTLMASPTSGSPPTIDRQAVPTAMYTRLSPELRAPGFLTTVELTPDQVISINSAGIRHCFLHDPLAPATQASMSGSDRRHFGTGMGHDGTANINTLVMLDKSFHMAPLPSPLPAGYLPPSGALPDMPALSRGLDVLVNGFGLNPNRPANDTAFPRITQNIYIVFGLGNKCTVVQSQMHEAPMLEHSNSTTTYSRALAVFEVPNVGTAKAKLVGFIGPDGRARNVAAQEYVTGPVPH